jgi:hypothetical protein
MTPAPTRRRVRPVDRTAAERKRRHRARDRQGRKVFDVEVREDAVIKALRASGRVPADKIPTRARIETELAEILAFWAERWNQTGHA